MNIVKKIAPYLLVIFLSFFAFRPLLQNGFFPMHDDTQVARVYEMAKSLKMGMFPVRWVPDLGYGLGYPIFNYYAPLVYYIGSIFVLLGANSLLATKITIILGLILSAIFMYLLSRELFGKWPAVLSSVFYTFAPYHALDLYVRGDLSEFYSYAFIPLVFWGLIKIFKQKNTLNFTITSIGFAAIILSHNLTAFMLTPFLVVYILIMLFGFSKKDRIKLSLYLFGSVLFGALLSFFYWFPAIFELNKTNISSVLGSGSHYYENFVCINQLWSSPWGFGGSVIGCSDGLSFMIGKLHIILAFLGGILTLSFLLNNKHKENIKYWAILGLFIAFLTSCFLTLDISKFIWDYAPFMSYLQFPWRFIMLATFFSSVLAGALLHFINIFSYKKIFPHIIIILSVIFIIGNLFLNVKFFAPQRILEVDSSFYTNELSLKWTTSKISDEYLPKNTIKPNNAKEALLNKKKFNFQQTPIELFSDLVSVAGILALIIVIINSKNKYVKNT